jgi:hypothetical protein
MCSVCKSPCYPRSERILDPHPVRSNTQIYRPITMAPTCKPCARYKNKPTKAKTPARTQGFFINSVVAPGRNRPGLGDVRSCLKSLFKKRCLREIPSDVGFARVPRDHFGSHRRSDVENVSAPHLANNLLQVCCDATTDRSVSQAPAVSQSMQSQNSAFWPWANLIQPHAKTVPDLACCRSD